MAIQTSSIAPVSPGVAARAIAALRTKTSVKPTMSPVDREIAKLMRKAIRTTPRAAKVAKPTTVVAPKAARVKRDPTQARIVYIGPKSNRQAHNVSHYRRAVTASGNVSLDCGDPLAKELSGLDLDAVVTRAARVLQVTEQSLRDRYGKLNNGLARMSIGNRVRAHLAREAAKAG